MHIDSARELKQELLRSAVSTRSVEPAAGTRPPLVVGVRTFGGGRYGVAVRSSGAVGADVAARAVELAGEEADVRDVGAIRPLTAAADQATARWTAEALQQRSRPLRPGVSLAQEGVTAGTLGAFVTLAGDQRLYVLSNNHVLGDSDRAPIGSAVLQPGPYDGGTAADQVATLAATVLLRADGSNVTDCAIAVLADDVEVDASYPVGPVTATALPDDDVEVEKVGRTTGLTRGRVTAIELDGVAVEYPVGHVVFDDQIEVTGTGGAFSAGGDSGSLVYRPDDATALGLLFAGSERGGPGGTGLTFCNPIDPVLEALAVRLSG